MISEDEATDTYELMTALKRLEKSSINNESGLKIAAYLSSEFSYRTVD